MDKAVPWEVLCDIVRPHYAKAPVGRKRTPLSRMLEILCLQQWYDLSDLGVEEEIYDRSSFQEFLGVDLLDCSVPDEMTVPNFRHLLEEHGLFGKIFEAVGAYLKNAGFRVSKGAIVDATIVAAPTSAKNKSKSRDPEMSSTKKNGQWHFGMKAHIGVDARSGIVRFVTGTTAKVCDSKDIDRLLDGREEAVFGDNAYGGKKRRKKMRDRNVYCGIADEKTRSRHLSSSPEPLILHFAKYFVQVSNLNARGYLIWTG